MRLLYLFFILLIPFLGKAQVTSIASGPWEDPLTWDSGSVPLPGDGLITIAPNHTVTISSTITANDIEVTGDAILTIGTGGKLVVVFSLTQDQADPGIPTLADAVININGGGILENRGSILQFSTSMFFANGSEYQHNQQNGIIPTATWQSGSTCRITGWLNANAIGTFRSSLSQNFHHFIWDSPNQTAPNVQLNGFLTTVSGDLIINSTGTAVGNRQLVLGLSSPITGSLSVGGNFTVGSNARVNVSVAGTYTVNIGGNCNLSATIGSAPQYQIVSSSGTTNFNVAGDFNLNSGTLNLSTTTGTGNLNISSNISLSGGVIAKPGTGIGNVTLIGATTHNLVVGSGTFTGGNLVVQAGTLNLSGNTLAMGGNITIQSGATFNMPAALSTTGNLLFVSGSTINSNNGTITLTGILPQTINANGAALNNITINKSIDAANVALSSPLFLTGQLNIISPNAGTVFNSGSPIGFLTLLSTSDAATGNAQIGPLLNTASIAGNVTVQRYMSTEGRIYRYISSPVTNAPVSQLQLSFPITGTFTGNNNGGCTGCSSNPSMFFYNTSLGLGQFAQFPVTANTEQLAPGRGYATYIRQDVLPSPSAPVVFNLTGPINQGNVSLPVVHNTSALESWNLVGNPYPSSIDWDDASWTKTNIAVPIAVRDNGVGMFRYWDGALGDIVDGIIATGQGFWVRTIGSSPVLTIRENAKSATNGAFFRTAGEEVITMQLTKGNVYDKAYVQLRDDASMGMDMYDAPKLVNDNFDFATSFNNAQLFAINSVSELACGTELFLDLRFTKTATNDFVMNPVGMYDLSFNIAGSEFKKYKISLVDQFTGTQLEVASGFSYSFSITDDPGSLSSNRLKLIFEGIPPSLTLAVAGPDVVCGDRDASVVVKNSDQNFNYFIFNNNQILSPEKTGNGGDLLFTLAGSQLTSGSNQVKIGVKGVCGIEFLTQTWAVSHYEDAAITIQEGDILFSNQTAGNQWYFNGVLIPGAVSQSLRVHNSGKYTVEINMGGCKSRAEIDYAVTGLESEAIVVSIFPNPFKDRITLTAEDLFNPATQISISNSIGQEVRNQSDLTRDGKDTGYFNLGNLSDGIYFISISIPSGTGVYKILKGSN